MSIHFKFKSAKEFDTVTFPGAVIRVLDLKKAIVDKKKLAKGLDFDLVITDAQNGKVYDDETTQLPRNTSVTVKRIPSQQPGSGLLARMKHEVAVAAAAAAAAAIHASPVVAPLAGPSPGLPAGLSPTQPYVACGLIILIENMTIANWWYISTDGFVWIVVLVIYCTRVLFVVFIPVL